MSLLEQEKTRLQAEIQAAATRIAALSAQLATRQQVLTTAQNRRSAAQTQLEQEQAQLPSLQSAANAADRRVEDANRQIAEHMANEPEPFIEIDDVRRPVPNPAWRIWKRELDRLTAARNRAQSDASIAHARLSAGQSAVLQAQGEVHAAESQIDTATAALQATQAAIAAAEQRQNTAQQQLAEMERWETEIARDPMDRPVLEQVAADLSAQAMILEEALTIARFQREDAEQRLAALTARRDELIPLLNDVNGRLPAAQAELQTARSALNAATRNVERHVQRGPLG